MIVRMLPNGRQLMDRQALKILTGRSRDTIRTLIRTGRLVPIERTAKGVPLYDAETAAAVIEATPTRRRRTVI